jgi:hypothetical protein
MSSLADIEDLLPRLSGEELAELERAVRHARRREETAGDVSIFDLPPLNLGAILRPLGDRDGTMKCWRGAGDARLRYESALGLTSIPAAPPGRGGFSGLFRWLAPPANFQGPLRGLGLCGVRDDDRRGVRDDDRRGVRGDDCSGGS